ncbi:serine/arginine repetitive matrix protein 1-like [Mercenaria mercenaria]|uniref:serine/arginine repetitive matrix protein 1-like n=1 Tax=Mercenaria mercenaria TaxID=6596 RepID=UPI00234E57D4|nr:serine/arginine repetitive matrix protein 1-like [Mercenaria mercenaria]
MKRIVEDQQRHALDLSNTIEEQRKIARNQLSDDQLFDVETEISDKTEREKKTVKERHEKKLSILLKESEVLSQPLQSNESESSESNKSGRARRRKSNNKKPKPAPRNSRKNDPKPPSDRNTEESSSAEKKSSPKTTEAATPEPTTDRNSKNVRAPGTKATYAEATRNGATIAQNQLNQTLQNLTKLLKIVVERQTDVSSGPKIRTHGGESRRGKRPFKEARRR